jgi:hypothetical protein
MPEEQLTDEQLLELQQQADTDPDELRAALIVRGEAESWVASHPEYIPSPENARLIGQWIESRALPSDFQSTERAFKALVAEGKLTLRDSKPVLTEEQRELLRSIDQMSSKTYRAKLESDPVFKVKAEAALDAERALQPKQTESRG